MKEEIHLFIVWEKGEYAFERIMQQIQARFRVLRVFRGQWSEERFSENLSRFYGQKLPPGCHKEKHCGQGPFTLVVVADESPQYGTRVTLMGKTIYVNTNIFDAKSLFRKWTGGGHRVHSTNDPGETDHDLALLFGIGSRQFIEQYPGEWDGAVIPLDGELVGARGWRSISQLFEVLNYTIPYIVLRNFECLPDQYHMASHGDIDLLTADLKGLVLITRAVPLFKQPYRVLHGVKIGGKLVQFDFRHVGDDYYDQKWEQDLLSGKVPSGRGFYVPNNRDYFYSLLYHASVHKRTMKDDYVKRLCGMAEQIGLEGVSMDTFHDQPALNGILQPFMQSNHYQFVRPQDKTVYFNKQVALSGGLL